jgi:uncharacterized protein (DUF1810 family)
MDDPHQLARFVQAQDEGGTYETAVGELRAGRKRGHWMWFVFPQIAGLGQSPMARMYALRSLDETRSYLAHPLLGLRLTECTAIVAGLEGRSAQDIFGAVDAMKLRSSMTLFGLADPSSPLYAAVLDEYFKGIPDAATERLLAGDRRPTSLPSQQPDAQGHVPLDP